MLRTQTSLVKSLPQEADRSSLLLLVLGVTIPIAYAQLITSANFWVRELANDHPARYFLMDYIEWLLTPLLAFGFYRATRHGPRIIIFALAGLFFAVYIRENFRGSFVDPGTFDQYLMPTRPWILPMVIAAAIGILGGLIHFRFHAASGSLRMETLYALAALAAVTGLAVLEDRRRVLDSVFAPTRQVVLPILFALLLVVFLWGWRLEMEPTS